VLAAGCSRCDRRGGTAAGNLRLSQKRAIAVLRGLVAGGIPVERFQILAKGATEPSV
jgi:outer membrane protein OmpA-like peptidoglycan-associated protein